MSLSYWTDPILRELAYDTTCCLEYWQHQKHASSCFPEVPGACWPGSLFQFISAISAPYEGKRGALFSPSAHVFLIVVLQIFNLISRGFWSFSHLNEGRWLCLFLVCRCMDRPPLLTHLWFLSWVALPPCSLLRNWHLLNCLKFSQFQLWELSTYGPADR